MYLHLGENTSSPPLYGGPTINIQGGYDMFAINTNPLTNGPLRSVIIVVLITLIMCGMGVYYALCDYLNGAITDDDVCVTTKEELYADMAALMQGEV